MDENNAEVVEEVVEEKYLELLIEKDSQGLVAVASTNATDRMGEIVDNNGWDLKAYKKNPVILWGHDHTQLPIGTSTKTWVEGTGKSAKLMIKPELHDVTPLAAAAKELVDRGIIKTLSVGFRPLESPDGITFTKNELLEVSLVNVPANAEAMMMAYKSLHDKGFDKEVIEDMGVKVDVVERLVEMDEKINELSELVKVQQHQSKKHAEKRLNVQKAIVRAADKLLAKQDSTVDRSLTKTIKRATELLTVAEKEKLNG